MTACRAAAIGASSTDARAGSEPGTAAAPLLQPVRSHGAGTGVRNHFEQGGLIQQGMADAAVAPVQQCQSPAIAAEIAWMKVAMDQGVPDSACGYILEPAGKPADKLRKHRAILRRDFVARPLDDVGDRF